MLRDAHVVKVDPKGVFFHHRFLQHGHDVSGRSTCLDSSAWQLSGLQNRPVKEALPYSRNEWKNMDKHRPITLRLGPSNFGVLREEAI
jgi:hypothetical protein